MMTEDEIEMFRKELQTKINAHPFCWICGRNDLLTEHHVINQKIQGSRMNLKIPICNNCMEVLHANDVIAALIKRIFLK